MGAGFDPAGDTIARRPEWVLAGRHAGRRRRTDDGAYAYTWKEALAAMAVGRLQPLRVDPLVGV